MQEVRFGEAQGFLDLPWVRCRLLRASLWLQKAGWIGYVRCVSNEAAMSVLARRYAHARALSRAQLDALAVVAVYGSATVGPKGIPSRTALALIDSGDVALDEGVWRDLLAAGVREFPRIMVGYDIHITAAGRAKVRS